MGTLLWVVLAASSVARAQEPASLCATRPEAEPAVVKLSFSSSREAVSADGYHGAVPGQPFVLGTLPAPAMKNLLTAYPIALQRVEQVESCRQLFTELLADGVETLESAVYSPASSDVEIERCGAAHAAAFTPIGSPRTTLCLGFGGLSKEAAATILIHEALHSAGLRERPSSPDALSSFQINRTVRRSCGL